MSMTVVEGRTLPSVFSDIPSRSALSEAQANAEKARRRIGQLGMWVFVLLGVVLLALLAAGAAYYYYDLRNQQLAALQRAYNDRDTVNQAYQELSRQREEIVVARRTLLDRLEGVNGMPRLNERQRAAGWEAARAAQFRAAAGGTREVNEPSQNWPTAKDAAMTTLQNELPIIRNATTAVQTAHARYAGGPTPPPCNDPTRC